MLNLCSTLAISTALTMLMSTQSIAASSNDFGELNPEEGGISQITQSLRSHPDCAGIVCWVVYEAQKGGLHAEAALRTCAESGNEPSMILMSHAYENGLGVAKNASLATYWVKVAALHG